MLCSLRFVGTREWIAIYHIERTASVMTAWDTFPHTKCQLINGDMFMILTLRNTGFLPARTLNVSYTCLL